MKDSLARIAPAETAIGRPTATARRLVNASVSDNTRRAYAGALGQLDAWLDGRRLDDAALAAYLAELHDAGRAAWAGVLLLVCLVFLVWHVRQLLVSAAVDPVVETVLLAL